MKIGQIKQIIQEEIKNKLRGGKGDKTSPNEVDQKELSVGKIVELEHTNDEGKAEEVALDHLTENPKYYSELFKSGIMDEKKALKLANQYGKREK